MPLTQFQRRSQIPEGTSQCLGGCVRLAEIKKKHTQEQTSDQSNRSPNFVNAHSDANPPAAPLYCAEFARPTEKTGSWVKTTRCTPPSEVCREQCRRWSQRIIARPDIFNMALALRARLNAEMRHVALASARAPELPRWLTAVTRPRQLYHTELPPRLLPVKRLIPYPLETNSV